MQLHIIEADCSRNHMLDGNHVTVVSDLHYCIICLDVINHLLTLICPSVFMHFSTSWCPSDMYIKLHLCRVLEASGSILVDIERYGICWIRS